MEFWAQCRVFSARLAPHMSESTHSTGAIQSVFHTVLSLVRHTSNSSPVYSLPATPWIVYLLQRSSQHHGWRFSDHPHEEVYDQQTALQVRLVGYILFSFLHCFPSWCILLHFPLKMTWLAACKALLRFLPFTFSWQILPSRTSHTIFVPLTLPVLIVTAQ